MQPLIDLALTLEIIDPAQHSKLSAIAEYVNRKDKDLADCNAEIQRLQALVDIDTVEDGEIAQVVSTIVDARI